MDGQGNIAVGYNVSSGSQFPSLRYAGRLVTDSTGTLPHGENALVEGSGSNSSNRYGDYSSINVDPSDDCTFWLTGEWNPLSTWATRIGSFKFDSCGGPVDEFTLLAPTPGTAGAVNDFDTINGTPNDQVFVMYGTSSGSGGKSIPGCGTVTFDIGGRIRLLGRADSDGAGSATVSRSIPGFLAGRTRLFQAVDLATCTTSNLITHTF
jgi:hypothetical protein